MIIGTTVQLIVIVNLRFLQHPQKRSHGNQLIHRCLFTGTYPKQNR